MPTFSQMSLPVVERASEYAGAVIKSGAVSAILVAFTGWTLGQSVWLIATPSAAGATSLPLQSLPGGGPSGAELSLDGLNDLATRNPFALPRGLSAVAESAPATDLSLQLKGLRASADPSEGTAMIAFENGPSKSYIAGEEVLPGVRLAGVYADRAIIDRAGALESLSFNRPQRAVKAAALPVPVQASAPTRPLIAPSVIAQIGFEPVSKDGKRYAYKVSTQLNEDTSRGLLIADNDFIIALDGAPATDFDAADLADRLRGYAPVSLSLIRDAKPIQVILKSEGSLQQ